MDTWKTPKPKESLADYVVRLRKALNLTQFELADLAGIHSRSVGKIERGLTVKINRRTLQGLASALGIPQEYLDATTKGEEVSLEIGVKFCPLCWNPGTPADPMWSNFRAKYCYLCGKPLRASCINCGELVLSLRHRFCPLCGHPYKEMAKT
ncbi:helix-turn-helix domain-containing protein [Floridanema evergladense]|uniref:Helix-turn-helix domain-containing protein n=1 Tax=Floridaenema evergladense BLCC-F167 TaxID=3153639 RepID=A0ABV4WIC9_9CYAN